MYANTGKNSSGNKDWINLKFDGLDLSNDDSCLGLYPDVWLNIELHGENTMISSGKSGSDYPTIDVAGYLYISGNGSLDVKNTGNYTAIGCKNTQLFTSASIWMYGGKIKAESSGEIPALQVGKEIKLYGGELQAVSKKDVPAIVAENFDISDDMCIAQPAGGIVQKDAYTYTDLYNRQYVLDTIAANSGTAENVVTIKSHIYNQQVVSDNYRAADATCTEPAKYYYSCQCGAKGTETFESGNSTGHDWGEPVYAWSGDGKTCTATRICKNDSSHTETATASVTGKQTKAPTCTEMGETTYTAVFAEEWAEEQTATLADIPAVGHTFEWKTDKEATQTEAGSKHEECAVCGYAKEAVSIAPSGAAQTPAENGASKTSPFTGAESAAVWIFIAAALGLCGTAVYGNKKKKYSK